MYRRPKRLAYGYCGMSVFAGPSEIMVVADESANPATLQRTCVSRGRTRRPFPRQYSSLPRWTLRRRCAGRWGTSTGGFARKEILDSSLSAYGAAIHESRRPGPQRWTSSTVWRPSTGTGVGSLSAALRIGTPGPVSSGTGR